MTDIVIAITKRVTVIPPEPRLIELNNFRGERFVSEVNVTWRYVDGQWRVERVAYTSALPKKDGTPSARWTGDIAWGKTQEAVFAAFPEAATPPAERVTITIEGAD